MPARIVAVTDGPGIAAVARLAREIWTATYFPLIGPQQTLYMLEKFQSRKAVREQIRKGMRYFLIRDEPGEAAGYFALAPEPEQVFVSKLYVDAGKRGRGYARQAVDYARMLAESLGKKRLALTVNRGNAAAIAAYLRLGFEMDGTAVTDIGGGFVMDDYRMVFKWD